MRTPAVSESKRTVKVDKEAIVAARVAATEINAVELSTSFKQLRQQIASADADTTAQALEQWAAQHNAKLDAVSTRMAADKKAEKAQAKSSRLTKRPTVDATLSPQEQQLVNMRYQLEVSKQAAIDTVPEGDVKAQRDAVRSWQAANRETLEQMKALAAQASTDQPTKNELRQERKRELSQRMAMSESELTTLEPSMSQDERKLAKLRAQYELKKLNFEESYADADPKIRRDAYRAFIAQNQRLQQGITTKASEVAAQQTPEVAEPEPTEEVLAELSVDERLGYEARRAFEQGRERLLAAHPDADEKQKRDLMRQYLNQTKELQKLMR